MSKILATLIAGLFAASVFAADAPRTDTKAGPAAATSTTAPATTDNAKPAPKHHMHHKPGKKAAATPTAPAATPAK